MIPRDEGSPAFGSRRVLALAVLCSAWLMIVLDFFIVNVALPAMQEDLGFSRENLQWMVSSYSIAFGGFLLLGGGGRRISSADGGCSGPGSLSSRWSRSSAGLRGRGACCSPPAPRRAWVRRWSPQRGCRSSRSPSGRARSETGLWAPEARPGPAGSSRGSSSAGC